MSRSFLLLAAALFLLPACNTAGAAPGQRINSWTKPHVLVIADGGDADTLNPHLTNFGTTANLSEMTMAWLLRWDAHNRLYAELATAVPTKANGGVSKDGRTITYHLRKGVTWSDGAPFDSSDVVFTVGVINNPANNETTRFDQVRRIEAPDRYTVVFHLKRPYSPSTVAFFSSCCANPPILPRHLLVHYKTINNVPYNNLPLGIGPFKFARWDRGKQIVLVANSRYWRGRPKLDEVIYRIVPDRDALLAQVQAHRIDMWYQFSGAYLPQIQRIKGYTIFRQPSYAYGHYDFNLTHPAVADSRVRAALRMALNREAVVANVEHGVGVVQDSATPPNAPYATRSQTVAYDPERANTMLDAAGWTRGRDGIRAKDGVRLHLAIASRTGSPDIDKQLERLSVDWKRIGVSTTIERYPTAKLFGKTGVINGNSWDVTTFAWAADPLGDYSGLYGCNAFPPAGFNDLRWCNKIAQRAMDDFVQNYDEAQRNADVRVTMEQFTKDVPSIVSFVRVDLFAYNSDLKNYRPNNLTPFDNMMNVDI